MEKHSDLPMAPADAKISLALSHSFVGLPVLAPLCQDPQGPVSTNSDSDLSSLQELVEWVLEEVTQRPHAVGAHGGPLILEVGCGSGAISLSLLSKLPEVSPLCIPPPDPL